MRHLLDVSTLSRWAMFHALSVPLQDGLCFFQPLPPAFPPARLAVMPARPCIGRKDRVSTFRTVDPMDDLGVPSTPMVQRFRAGS
jgi:hypothetical protein